MHVHKEHARAVGNMEQFSTQELVEGVKKIQEQYQNQLKDLAQEQAKAAPTLKYRQQHRQNRSQRYFLNSR